MISTSKLEKLAEKGFNLDEFLGELVFNGGLYHSPKCEGASTRIASGACLAFNNEVPWSRVLSSPEDFCSSCYQSMVFGGMQVKKWFERITRLMEAETLLESKPESFDELSETFSRLNECVQGHDKFLPSWVEELKSRIRVFRESVTQAQRYALEPEMIKLAVEEARAAARALRDPLLGIPLETVKELEAEVSSKLSDTAPRFLIRKAYVAQLNSFNQALQIFYGLGPNLLFVPRAVLALFRNRSELDCVEVSEPLDPRVLEALSVLYDPQSTGPYSRIQETLEAAKVL